MIVCFFGEYVTAESTQRFRYDAAVGFTSAFDLKDL